MRNLPSQKLHEIFAFQNGFPHSNSFRNLKNWLRKLSRESCKLVENKVYYL